MLTQRRPWLEELAIIDRVMKSISDVTNPETLVSTYWEGISELLPLDDFLALSRRGVEAPDFLITRSSRFKEHFNPWTQRDKLPRMRGGLLGEIAYADAPLLIEDLPSRLKADDPGRFYLEGFAGAICLPQYEGGKGINVGITFIPHGVQIDKSIVPMLHWQASLFGRGTQNLVLRNQLTAALRDLDRELQVVGEIQRSLLPQELPRIAGYEMAAHYETSARAGGDYYDFFELDEHAQGVFIADVSGHGTPAAVLMAITHAIAHSRPGAPRPPSDLLAYINQHLARSYTLAGTFVTAFYATLDTARGRLTYATAGHNPPRLLRGDRVMSLDKSSGLPLGILGDSGYDEATIALEPGDLLLLYTDGITEAMTPADGSGVRQLFGTERLDAILLEHRSGGPEEVLRAIREAVGTFSHHAPATDDRTLIAIRRVE